MEFDITDEQIISIALNDRYFRNWLGYKLYPLLLENKNGEINPKSDTVKDNVKLHLHASWDYRDQRVERAVCIRLGLF
jgi:hypothetical protein